MKKQPLNNFTLDKKSQLIKHYTLDEIIERVLYDAYCVDAIKPIFMASRLGIKTLFNIQADLIRT